MADPVNSSRQPLPLPAPDGSSPILVEAAANMGTSVVGALVGLAVGGPVGAVVGAAAPPALLATMKVVHRALDRRRARAAAIVADSFSIAAMTPEDATAALERDDSKVDDFVALLRQALDSDPPVHLAFSALLAELLRSTSTTSRDRVVILADSLSRMRTVHLNILLALHENNGVLAAAGLADHLGIPEVELRSVVRDLELRGMIKDRGKHPVEWELRTLGSAVVELINQARSTGQCTTSTTPEAR